MFVGESATQAPQAYQGLRRGESGSDVRKQGRQRRITKGCEGQSERVRPRNHVMRRKASRDHPRCAIPCTATLTGSAATRHGRRIMAESEMTSEDRQRMVGMQGSKRASRGCLGEVLNKSFQCGSKQVAVLHSKCCVMHSDVTSTKRSINSQRRLSGSSPISQVNYSVPSTPAPPTQFDPSTTRSMDHFCFTPYAGLPATPPSVTHRIARTQQGALTPVLLEAAGAQRLAPQVRPVTAARGSLLTDKVPTIVGRN